MNIYTECPRIEYGALLRTLNIFLATNTRLLAHCLRIPYDKIFVAKIEDADSNANLFEVGTSTRPLIRKDVTVSPGSQLVILYNVPLIGKGMMKQMGSHNSQEEDLWRALGWAIIAMAMRRYLINQDLILPRHLIPLQAMTELRLPLIRGIFIPGATDTNGMPNSPEDHDIDIIGAYVARTITDRANTHGSFTVADLADIICNSTAETWFKNFMK